MATVKDPNSLGAWRGRLAASRSLNKEMLTTWRDNVSYRRGKPFKTQPSDDTVNIPADWSRTKNKQAQLFAQLPELKLLGRNSQWMSVAPVFAAALNFELSEKVHAEHTMNECLGDVINAAGIMIAKVGYDATFEMVDMPLLDQTQYPPEVWQQMEQAGQIPTKPTPQVVYQCFYTERISPAHFLRPVEFTKSDWQKAPWLGWEGYKPLAEAKRLGWVDDTFEGVQIEESEWLLIRESEQQKGADGWVKFQEVFYRPSWCDATEKDPRKIKRLVLVDGIDKKVVDEDFQWQRYDEGSKRWIGMTSFPIKVSTLVKISDLAVPPSDSEMGRSQVRELIKSRSQMIKQRDRSQPLRWFDINQVDDEIADRLRHGKLQDMIPMNGPGDHAIGEVARAHYPPENWEFDKIIKSDLDESWSMGAPQMSTPTPGDTTATEIDAMNSSLNVRLEAERGWVLQFYIELAQGVASLMQLFSDDVEEALIVGQDGAQILKQWNKDTIQGEYVFKIKPDSQLKLDINQKRVEALNLYKLLRQDPLINPQELVMMLVEVHGLDPSKVIVPPQPPKPEKPKVSYSFKGEDLQSPLVVAVMQKTDAPVTPEDIAAAKKLIEDVAGMTPPMQPEMGNPESGGPPTGENPPHPGPADVVQPLNRRYEQSGTSVRGSRDSGVPTPQK